MRRTLLIVCLAGLAAVGLGLPAVTRFFSGGRVAALVRSSPLPLSPATARSEIDEVCTKFRINPKSGHTRRISGAGGTGMVEERRYNVQRTFSSIEFNYALNSRLLPYGAHVEAYEHSKEQSVTMNVVRDGRTLYSVILDSGNDHN